MLEKIESIMPGSKTYIVSGALFIIGLAGYVDPGLAEYIGGIVGMDPSTVLMIAALLMAFLRKITNQTAAI